MLVLQRPRSSAEGKLFVTGRDIEEERTLAMRFDHEYKCWQITEEGKDGLSPERRHIIDVLRTADKPLAPIDVARLSGKPYEAVKKLLARMYEEGFLGRHQGLYRDISQNRVPESPEELSG